MSAPKHGRFELHGTPHISLESDYMNRFTRMAVKLGHLSLWLGFLIGATIVL